MKTSVALVLFLFAFEAHGITFRLERGGEVLSGGEICMFDARTSIDPVARLTTYSNVKCVSADRDVLLPKGRFNIFARHQEGYVSPSLLLADDGKVKNDVRVIELVRAERLQYAAPLEKDETAGVYIESTGVVLPLVPGETSILVPDDTSIIPLFMTGGRLERVGPVQMIHSDSSRTITRPAALEGRRDLAVGLVPDIAALNQNGTRGRVAGTIELACGNAPVEVPLNRVDAAFKGLPAIAFFAGVTCDGAVIKARVKGNAWLPDEVDVRAFQADRPLRITATTLLTVQWGVAADLVSLSKQNVQDAACQPAKAQSASESDIPGSPQEGLTLTVARCSGLQPQTASRSIQEHSCVAVASAALDTNSTSGEAHFKQIPSGVYLLRLAYGKLPPTFETTVVAGGDSTASIDLRYDRWFGRVTRNREPVHARVAIGSGAVSDAHTGEYFAISTPAPPIEPSVAARLFKDPAAIAVIDCKSGLKAMFVPDDSPVPNSRFDISISSNVVKVNVVDHASGQAIAEASVEYSVLRKDDTENALYVASAGVTDKEGRVAIADVASNREVLICAERANYHRSCAPRFVMKADPTRDVNIELDRSDVREGVVHHPAIGGGQVEWYRPDGAQTESTSVAADGSFRYRNLHRPDEIVVVVSAGTPLLVFHQPPLDDGQTFEISFPAAPVRSFRVSLSPRAREPKGFLTLSIGDFVVPLKVFSDHLRFRGGRPFFLAPGVISVPDILATDTISFIFAPFSWAEVYGGNRGVDFFYLPAAATLPRVQPNSLGEATVGE